MALALLVALRLSEGAVRAVAPPPRAYGQGSIKAFNKAVVDATNEVNPARNTCHNGDKEQFKTAYETAKKTCESPYAKLAWTLAQNIMCIVKKKLEFYAVKDLRDCKRKEHPAIPEIIYSNANCDKITCEPKAYYAY